jgi:hypothetical protein
MVFCFLYKTSVIYSQSCYPEMPLIPSTHIVDLVIIWYYGADVPYSLHEYTVFTDRVD